MVLSGDGVGYQEVYYFDWGETSVTHTREDLVDVVVGLGDEAQSGGVRRVRASREELQARCTRAVRDRDGTCELDKITSSHLEGLEEGLEVVDSIVDTVVGSCKVS